MDGTLQTTADGRRVRRRTTPIDDRHSDQNKTGPIGGPVIIRIATASCRFRFVDEKFRHGSSHSVRRRRDGTATSLLFGVGMQMRKKTTSGRIRDTAVGGRAVIYRISTTFIHSPEDWRRDGLRGVQTRRRNKAPARSDKY